MSFLILFLILSIAVIILFNYRVIFLKRQEIINFQIILNQELDKRFYLFQSLIDKSVDFIDYQQTFLNEIVQLRSQAQKHKQEENIEMAYLKEEKISQLAIKIDVLFKEFPKLHRISNAKQMIEHILANEEELLILKKEYNNLVKKYNNLLDSPFMIIFNKFFDKIEKWEMKN